MTITMIEKEMKLKDGTKTVYKEIGTTTTIIDEEKYNAIVRAKKFFQGFNGGGKEWHSKNYTKAGYIVNRILTTSPDKKIKIERMFLFA